MEHSALEPDSMSAQIMGRVHVYTSDAEALLAWSESLEDIQTIPARNLLYAAARAIAQHHENLAKYLL